MHEPPLASKSPPNKDRRQPSRPMSHYSTILAARTYIGKQIFPPLYISSRDEKKVSRRGRSLCAPPLNDSLIAEPGIMKSRDGGRRAGPGNEKVNTQRAEGGPKKVQSPLIELIFHLDGLSARALSNYALGDSARARFCVEDAS